MYSFFRKCSNLILYVLQVTWIFCTSSGGRYWLVVIKTDCVFFSVTIVIIIIFRFMYKSSIFGDLPIYVEKPEVCFGISET